jgi:hypothetical protein
VGGETAGRAGVSGRSGAEAGGATALGPVTEEMTLRCSESVIDRPEDEDLKVIGSERGSERVIFAEGDIVYLNRGAKAGLKAGDVYTTHRRSYDVVDPITGRKVGTKLETHGWLRLILVQDNVATAVIEHSCSDTQTGDYLKPFQPVSVPVVAGHSPADRLTPPTGKLLRHVVDIENDLTIAAAGHLVTIDAGSQDGITPGNIFTIFRVTMPGVPTPRNVVGELIVVAVRERTATAKVTYSGGEILLGDQIELH